MTDLTRLRDLPELPPLPGQVEEAVVQVRRRRRRSAMTTLTSATAAVMAAALLLTHPGSGSQSLEPAHPEVPHTAAAVPTLTGHGGVATKVSGPRFATPTPPVRYLSSGGGTAGGEAAAEGPDEQPAAAVRPRPPVQRYDYSSYTNPDRAADGRHYSQPCGPGVGVPTGTSGCRGALSRDEGDAGTTLFQTTCSSMGSSEPETLHFETEQEAEFVVYTDVDRKHELWRSSTGLSYAAYPHDVVHASGDCSEWSVLWDRMDEAGRAMPPGRYWFAVTITTDKPYMNGSYFTIS